jgi:hypothetical protein
MKHMTERAKINRPITSHEIAVIRATLERSLAAALPPTVTGTLENLRAIDQCGCGCDSVDFVPHDPINMSWPIAEGLGTTPAGGEVGVIVWGREDGITGLEIYDMGAGDDDIRLPLPTSIRPFVTGES